MSNYCVTVKCVQWSLCSESLAAPTSRWPDLLSARCVGKAPVIEEMPGGRAFLQKPPVKPGTERCLATPEIERIKKANWRAGGITGRRSQDVI